MILPILATAGLLAGCGPPPPVPGEPSLVLLTWNVHFEVSGDPEASRVIREAGADLVLLQETNPEWQARLETDLAGLYPHRHWVDAGVNGGIALLSRTPLDEVESLPSPVGWFPALRAVASTGIGPIQVLGVHLHPPVSESGSFLTGVFTSGEARLAEICDHRCALLPGIPTVIAGDFNAGAWEPSVRVLAEEGWRDAVSAVHPLAPTWRGRIRGILPFAAQLDHVLLPPDFRAVDVRILHDGPSDHWPVRVVLARTP